MNPSTPLSDCLELQLAEFTDEKTPIDPMELCKLFESTLRRIVCTDPAMVDVACLHSIALEGLNAAIKLIRYK